MQRANFSSKTTRNIACNLVSRKAPRLLVVAVFAISCRRPLMVGSFSSNAMMQAIVYSRADQEGIRLTTKPCPKTNSSSHLICRVAYAGVNPVDVKFLVGDKLPEWCHGLGRWAVEGRTVGFDFAGTVVRAAPGDKRFKPGDAVFGTAPPGVGTFCEVGRLHSKKKFRHITRRLRITRTC